jgi:hypothetical protein
MEVRQQMTEDATLFHDDQMLQAFRMIAGRLEGDTPAAPLRTLRERLAGELLGDEQRVAATLDPAFTLVTHTGGPSSTTSGPDMVDGIKRQGEIGVMLWVSLDELVVDTDVVAGEGLLHTFHTDTSFLTTFPLAFFIRFTVDGLMASEVAFMDVAAAVTTALPNVTPSFERLRSLLDFSVDNDN